MANYIDFLQQLFQHGLVNTTAPNVDQSTGAIFAVRKKEHFTVSGVKGYIIKTQQTIMDHANTITHFTPNIYRKYAYVDKARTFITGFEERNLHQVNTFVVDIDTKTHSVQEMTLACIDEAFGPPTCIVESARGYQLYFMLEKPFYMDKTGHCLKIAKRIAYNIKRALHSIDADLYCNDFGFFRIPNAHNVVYMQLEQTYTIDTLIQWSMREDDFEKPFYAKAQASGTSLTQSDWFTALVRAIHIKGKKGVLGRNNALFTLSLACFADGWAYERTYDFLDELNSAYITPLSHSEVETLLRSAYSGKYSGPAKHYIEELLAQYVPHFAGTISTAHTAWYKFKKERHERVRSHYDELEEDLLTYITAAHNRTEPFIWHTQNELCGATGISQSSLNALLKRTTKIKKVVHGKGRGAKTGWTTVSLLVRHAVESTATKKAQFSHALQQLMTHTQNTLTINIQTPLQYTRQMLFNTS